MTGTETGKPIDVHTHIFPDAIAPNAMAALIAVSPSIGCFSDGTRAGLIEQMDKAGVGRAVAAAVATKPTQMESIFRFSKDLLEDPRMIPFPSVHPSAPDATDWIRRAADEGFLGVKAHPQYQDCPVDDPKMTDILEAIRDNDIVLLLHTGNDPAFPNDNRAAPTRVARLLDRVEGARVIAAHLGGWMVWEEALEVLAGRPGLYLDTSSSLGHAPREMALAILEKHGVDRVCFATDSPWEDIAAERERVEGLGLSEEDTRKVLWKNAEELLFGSREGAASAPDSNRES